MSLNIYTRDILTNEEITEGLLDGSFSGDFVEDQIQIVASGSFAYLPYLTGIKLENVDRINYLAFLYNGMEKMNFSESFPSVRLTRSNYYASGNNTSERISSSAFSNMYNLRELVLDNSQFVREYDGMSLMDTNLTPWYNSWFNNVYLTKLTWKHLSDVPNRVRISDSQSYNGGIIYSNTTNAMGFVAENIFLPDLTGISEQSYFLNNSFLKNLIIGENNNSVISLSNPSNIANHVNVFVPDSLIDEYRSDTNWATFTNIFPMSQYENVNDEIITDSWEDVVTACNDGTYVDKYRIGQKIFLNIPQYGFGYMVYDGTLKEELADGTGYAKMSFFCENFFLVADVTINENGFISISTKFPQADNVPYYTDRNGNNYFYRAYSASSIRQHMNDIFNKMPSALRANNGIKTVKKYTKEYDEYGNLNRNYESSEKVHLRSYRELFGGDNVESLGADYSDYYTMASARQKSTIGGSSASYLLRTAYSYRNNSSRTIYIVNSSGSATYSNGHDTNIGIAFAFCI